MGNASMPDNNAPLKDTASQTSAGSLQDELQRLVDDARGLAEAELAYQKARAAYAGMEVRRMAVLGALAAVLVFFALMALTLGLVLALSPQLSPLGATAVVCSSLLVVALACAMLAVLRWKRMTATISEEAQD